MKKKFLTYQTQQQIEQNIKQQSQEKVLFTINLNISKKQTQLDVKQNDDINTLVDRLCISHYIKLKNRQKIKRKLQQYLQDIIKNYNDHTKNTSRQLHQSIVNFVKKNKQTQKKDIQIDISQIALGKQSKTNKIKQNTLKQDKKNTQKIKDLQLLTKAYQSVYKKSKDPVFKSMAQSYLSSLGNKQVTNMNLNKSNQQSLMLSIFSKKKDSLKDNDKIIQIENFNLNQKDKIQNSKNKNLKNDQTPVKMLELSSINNISNINHNTNLDSLVVSSIKKNQQKCAKKNIGIIKNGQKQNKNNEKNDKQNNLFEEKKKSEKSQYKYLSNIDDCQKDQVFLRKRQLYENENHQRQNSSGAAKKFNYFLNQK